MTEHCVFSSHDAANARNSTINLQWWLGSQIDQRRAFTQCLSCVVAVLYCWEPFRIICLLNLPKSLSQLLVEQRERRRRISTTESAAALTLLPVCRPDNSSASMKHIVDCLLWIWTVLFFFVGQAERIISHNWLDGCSYFKTLSYDLRRARSPDELPTLTTVERVQFLSNEGHLNWPERDGISGYWRFFCALPRPRVFENKLCSWWNSRRSSATETKYFI